MVGRTLPSVIVKKISERGGNVNRKKEKALFLSTLGEPLGKFPEHLKQTGEHVEIIKELLSNSKYEWHNLWTDGEGNFTVYGCDLKDVKSYAQ